MPETKPILEFNPDRIDNPVLQFFLDYWRQKRGARSMPSRADLSPREIKPYLGWVCLLDALPDYSDFRYRLVGSYVSDYFLGDGTGRTVSDSFSENQRLRDGVLYVFREICTRKQPLRLWSPGGAYRSHYYSDSDALHLPLAANGETADMVMNVFTFNYEEFKRTRSQHVLTHKL